MCPPDDMLMLSDFKGELLAQNGTMCLKFIDTDQERKIDVGMTWPYEKLKPYECLISDEFYEQGVTLGDKITITLSWTDFWQNMRTQYNEVAQLPENQWGEIPHMKEKWKK